MGWAASLQGRSPWTGTVGWSQRGCEDTREGGGVSLARSHLAGAAALVAVELGFPMAQGPAALKTGGRGCAWVWAHPRECVSELGRRSLAFSIRPAQCSGTCCDRPGGPRALPEPWGGVPVGISEPQK